MEETKDQNSKCDEEQPNTLIPVEGACLCCSESLALLLHVIRFEAGIDHGDLLDALKDPNQLVNSKLERIDEVRRQEGV